MSTRTQLRMGTATVAALLTLIASPAAAINSCIDDAKIAFQECKGDCKETFQEAKDTCLNRDHACVEVCRAEREQCRIDTGFDGAIAACNATLAGAKQDCRELYGPGTSERDRCIDQAQVVAFQCRDGEREIHKPALKLCRSEFKACARACPPADPPSSADPVQCKIDAKNAYLTCKAGCIEDRQFAKDVCRNRDHLCMEGCREDRDEECLAPVLARLLSDIAGCNATRNGAIQTCEELYGEGTPERDTCIDNAQVAAFQCRDQKREDAKPDIAGCRQAFRTCAQGCPPAVP